ncbi:MAG: ROK family protein, partial [Anaerolineales bacterium]|nr:ROK family protein [Anaerolineales bacterium]
RFNIIGLIECVFKYFFYYAILQFMNSTIAVDIGASRMRAGSYTVKSNEPIQYNQIPTRSDGMPIEDRLVNLIESVWPDDYEVKSIAAACPGPLDPINGIVIEPPNIPEWHYFPLQEFLQSTFNLPTAINNDANLAAYGEWTFGAGKGTSNLIYLTISTGIGGGIIIDNKLLTGTAGYAGEIGHITIDPQGPICSCGKEGHLEAIASGPSIVRWIKSCLEDESLLDHFPDGDLTAKLISDAAETGNELAIAAYERAGKYIGLVIANLLHIFNTSMIIIGGGVSKAGDLLFDPIRKSVHNSVISDVYLDNLQILPAALGDDSGLMGALVLSREIAEK